MRIGIIPLSFQTKVTWPPRIVVFLLLCGLPGFIAAQDHSTTLVFPDKSHAPIRKATGTHLFLAVGLKTKVDDPQGTAVAKLEAMDDPDTEKDDDELTVYGINAGRNEIIYNTSLVNIEVYRGESGTDQGLNAPRGITANPAGDVYVADMGNSRVVRLFNPEGKQLKYRGAGRPPSREFVPFDVSLVSDGSVVVSDSAGGALWRWFPERDHWERLLNGVATPLGVVVYDGHERWTAYDYLRIGVVADDGQEILVLNSDGEILHRYKPEVKTTRFRYIAVDYYNNYYATDVAHGRIVKIGRHAQFIDTIGSEGKGDYEFLHPQGISIWNRFGQVCVAESYAAQYYLIGTDIRQVQVESRGDHLRLSCTLTEKAKVTVTARHLMTDTTFHLLESTKAGQGLFSMAWRFPEVFPAGRYMIEITAVPSYSSTKYFTAKQQLYWSYQPNTTTDSEAEVKHE